MTASPLRRWAMLVVANEVLNGNTRDANLQNVARHLSPYDARIIEARVVEDVHNEIVSAVDHLRERYEHVIVSGGLGPTHDDITAECIAGAFCVKRLEHPEAVRQLQSFYERRQATARKEGKDPTKLELNEHRLKMALLPEGAVVIENIMGAAPGFTIGNVSAFPGIPRELNPMIEKFLLSLSKSHSLGPSKFEKLEIRTGMGEGKIGPILKATASEYPAAQLGVYPLDEGPGATVRILAPRDLLQRLKRQVERALEVAEAG